MGSVAHYVLRLAEVGTWFRHGDGEIYWGATLAELEPELPSPIVSECADSLVPCPVTDSGG
jgi:hypothetical protein